MNFDLTDEQRLLRETVRDFAVSEVAPVAEELDRTKAFPYEIVEKLGDLGLMGIPFPEEFGGSGGDILSYALAVEELARIDSSVAITMAAHTSLGTTPIYNWGTDEQKAEWLPQLTSGKKLAAFGLPEPEAGSDAGNTKPRAELDGEGTGRGVQATLGQRRQRRRYRRVGVLDERRGDRDEVAAVTLIEHPGHRGPGDLEEAAQVHPGDGVVVLVGVVGERFGDEDARVVDDGVDAPEAVDRRVDHASSFAMLCDVARDGQHHRVVTGFDGAGVGHHRVPELAVSGDQAGADSL